MMHVFDLAICDKKKLPFFQIYCLNFPIAPYLMKVVNHDLGFY